MATEQERIKELEKENAVLKQRLRLYELPSPLRAYYVGQKILNQQVDYLDKFDFSTEILADPKKDKVYDRAMEAYEKLTGNASKLNALKVDIGLSGNEEKDLKNPIYRITPETMADSIGELAGKRS